MQRTLTKRIIFFMQWALFQGLRPFLQTRFRLLRISIQISFIGWMAIAQTSAQVDQPVTRIAFGSCADQNRPCPIWGTIADYQPELLLLLGDIVYADVANGRVVASDASTISSSYAQLAANDDFVRLKQHAKVMATWDDHDYGKNDAGIEWQHKDASAALFHDFFGTPADSPRRSQFGIYHSEIFGPVGKRVQVIMLDTRYFRSKLEQALEPKPGWRARPYIPATDPNATLLGEAQWIWLEQQLRAPAEVRLLCSSIQVLSDEHPFEMWANFPNERIRLYQLIKETQAGGVIILSGDRHLGEISLDNSAVGYPLFDVTASGLNQAEKGWRPMEPNAKRVAGLQIGNHFGSIEIDWLQTDPIVSLQLRLENGEIGVQSLVPISRLRTVSDHPDLPEGVSSPGQALSLEEGSQVRLQFRVAAGRQFGDTGRLLLNSMEDFRSPENITVVLNSSALVDRFQGATLEDFKGKSIRVRGMISLYRGQKQVVVDSVEQLEVVD